ncbi:aspartic peptidase A1 family protein, partial [Tanacetum coccineum]
SCPHEVLSQYEITAILRVTKDANTSLYKVGLTLWDYAFEERGYLLDLDAPFTWEHCLMSRTEDCMDADYCYFPLPCDNSNHPSVNPVSNTCKISQLTSRLLYLSGTDGRDQKGNSVNLQFMLSCAPPYLRRSLPEGVTGVAAFSWSNLAFPRQQFNDRVTEKFALCLPSSSLAPGKDF